MTLFGGTEHSDIFFMHIICVKLTDYLDDGQLRMTGIVGPFLKSERKDLLETVKFQLSVQPLDPKP